MSIENPKRPADRFSPRNFLRARRPERFSDSERLQRSGIDRSILEYHLDTLTSRSQEAMFEEFARQLLQKEVCPNLLPHTGPTGGGDSKVDSETYPVASSISATWLVGHAENAGSERWAFAISAKKKWKDKVRKDVASIAGTVRGYTRIFFISNQFVKDKDRAAEEDALTRSSGSDVRIFDRTWILDRVFSNHHEGLAVSALQLNVPPEEHIQLGSADTQRSKDLAALEESIVAALSSGPSIAVVDDCLEAALLARGLDKPRLEVDGYFARAQRIADQYGTPHQQLEAHYAQAWTAFWWYEDFGLFLAKYADVERMATESENIADAESLSNLWTVLASSVKHGNIPLGTSDLERRTRDLERVLDRLRSHEGRPSVSLQARALIATMELSSAAPDVPDAPLREMKAIVDESRGLIGFSLIGLSDLVTELLPHLIKSGAFSALFDALTAAVRSRQGEVAGARLLLQKGAAELRAERPYEALRTISPALSDLYKEESRRDMVGALFLCARAYESVGLLWAARGALLHAASLAANEWWTHSTIHPALRRAIHGLKWVELQLGRIPQVLAWHEAGLGLKVMAEGGGTASNESAERESAFDATLGILLLRADLWQLRDMRRLPDSLQKLGLETAALSLLFALGYDEPFELGGTTITTEEQEGDFRRLAEQSVAADLPRTLSLGHERTIRYSTVVLGCTIAVAADNRSHCIALTEAFLSAVEGLLATAVFETVMPRAGKIDCRVAHSDFATAPFALEMTDVAGFLTLEFRCPAPNADESIPDQHSALKAALVEALARLVARGFMVRDDVIETLVGRERAMRRALDFSAGFGAVYNVLGMSPRFELSDWTPATSQEAELRRSEEWDAEDRRARQSAMPSTLPRADLPRADVPPQEGMPDLRGVKHSDFRFESLIRLALWDAAQWTATGWAASPGRPPWMILGFRKREPAAAILRHLVEDVGDRDPQNRLRITIIRGIDRRHSAHYRVVIGSNVDAETFKKVGLTIARIQTMTPTSSNNLDVFLEHYEKAGAFLLGAGVMTDLPGFFGPVITGERPPQSLLLNSRF